MVIMANNKYDEIFEQELLPHADALSTFAFHLTYNEADADDLVQDTYMKAYRFIHKYDQGTNAKAWLFKILKNAFINNYRKKAKQPTKVDIDELIIGEGDIESYTDLRVEMFDKMMGDEVTTAINNLPVDSKMVILLSDIEGFTYEEISKIIDTPLGTVRSRLHRARNLLKNELKTYAVDLGYGKKEEE